MIKLLFFSFTLALTTQVFASQVGYLEVLNSPTVAVNVEAELTTMQCVSNSLLKISVVKARFQGQPVRLYIKREIIRGPVGPTYETLNFKHNLNDQVFVYESKGFTLSQYSFATGKKSTLVSKSGFVTGYCESTGE